MALCHHDQMMGKIYGLGWKFASRKRHNIAEHWVIVSLNGNWIFGFFLKHENDPFQFPVIYNPCMHSSTKMIYSTLLFWYRRSWYFHSTILLESLMAWRAGFQLKNTAFLFPPSQAVGESKIFDWKYQLPRRKCDNMNLNTWSETGNTPWLSKRKAFEWFHFSHLLKSF